MLVLTVWVLVLTVQTAPQDLVILGDVKCKIIKHCDVPEGLEWNLMWAVTQMCKTKLLINI